MVNWLLAFTSFFLSLVLAVLTLYSVVRPRLITKPFKEPSFDVYNRLMHDHSDTLKCPCSLVSSIYDRYVKIEPIFHQVKTNNHSIFLEYESNLSRTRDHSSRFLPR